MPKQIRIRIYLNENLEKLEPLFFETYKKKSLIGTFVVNFLAYLEKNFSKEFTERLVKEVACGNYEILKELLSSSKNLSFDSSNKDVDSDLVHQDINLDDLLLE
ncbi:MAG: hypothetical protein ACP5QP_07565 [Brevinematia bacterium]